MYKADWLPNAQLELLNWGQNAQSLLTDNYSAYGLAPAAWSAFETAFNDYAAALAVATAEATRTRGSVAAKQAAKKEFRRVARETIALVQAHPGLTEQQRADLRINMRENDPTPIPPPVEAPVLVVSGVLGRVVSLRLSKQGGTGRPWGAQRAWLFVHVGESAPTDPQAMLFAGESTKLRPTVIVPEGVAAGSKVWVSAAWVNPRGESGPASLPQETRTNWADMGKAA